MESSAWVVGAACVVVGLFGIVVPVLPGLFLCWVGVLAWAIMAPGWTPWVFFGVASALYAAGLITEVMVPGKRMKTAGVRWSTQVVGVVGAIVCSFLVPVVGFFLGFPLAVFLWELVGTRNARKAWQLTVHAIKGMGMNMLIELTTGFLIAATFAIGAVSTAL